MQDVIRRIKKNRKITSTADYQINRLIDFGKSTEEIERILKEALDATYPEMYELYDEVINWQYVRNAEIYEQINGRFLPPEENEWMNFNSRPCERGFYDAGGKDMEMWISIHAPARGASYTYYPHGFTSEISIHAPARGASYNPSDSITNVSFQFTPLREGLRSFLPRRCPAALFQFTPLREGLRGRNTPVLP